MTNRGNLADILDEYLRALEAGNPPDREALLAQHPELAEELQSALLGVDFVYSAAPRLAPDEHAETQPGRSLGDYRLIRELGRGGMAVVYEAEQISLGRHVALKVLPFAAVLDPKQLQRFKNEALAAAHLHHANIVPVYGVGCERGVHYYAMQFVEGQSLATAIRDLKEGGTGEEPKTPISSHGSNREPAYIRMAAMLGVQAAEALDHAHQLGIVHRDVKPGNLLVDQAGTLWVTDFGVASSVANVGLTMTGELLGTIRYMSPEQALAKRAPIDHRTDVYSLGATLYELFTLEPAFPGDDPHVVIHDIATKEPVLPRRLNPAIPSDLETVLLKAMSKEPAHRYATALEMAEDLTHFLENRPIEAKRPGFVRRASQWSRRHRTLVGATAALLLLSTAGFATGSALLWHEQAQTQAAFGTAQANLILALQALDQIYIVEAESHPKLREGLPKDLLEKGLGFYEKFVKENVGNESLVLLMASAYHRAGLIYRALGEEVRAVESINLAVSAYDKALESNPRDTRATHNRGIALGDAGRFEEALASHERTLEIDPLDTDAHNSRGAELCDHFGKPGEALAEFDRAIELDPRNALAHMNRGNALLRLGRFEEALAACDRALEINSRHDAIYASRAAVLHALGHFEDALAACDRAIEINPRNAGAHSNRGTTLMSLRRFEEALAAYDRSLAIDPRLALVHANRGDALRNLERFDEALTAYDRAIEIAPRNADAHSNRGDALGELGRFDEALAACDRALAIDPRIAGAHSNRATALRGLKRFDESLAACDRALEINPRDAKAQNSRGIALQFLGRFEEALAAYDRAIEIDPRNALIHLNRGALLCDYLGQPGEALAAFDRAVEIDPQDARAQNNRSVALTALGRFDDALAACDRAIEIDSRVARSHSDRGAALNKLRRFKDALEACDRAIEIDSGIPHAHTTRGTALNNLGRFEDALTACDKAIEIDPQYALAHHIRANALYMLKRFEQALEAIERSIELDPQSAAAHNARGAMLVNLGRFEAAIDAYGEVVRLRPDDALVHCNLGNALTRGGRFREAVPCFRRGHELGSMRADWPDPSGKWIEEAERKAELEGRLDQVLSGKARPRDAEERIEFAPMLYAKARHAESARMYAEAFAEDAALAEDLATGRRYDAACSAALAAVAGGADAAAWRGQALEWLRADLAAREKTATGLAATLEHWKVDPDFASVRGQVGDLPELERDAWRGLWTAVDLALATALPAVK